MEAGCEHESVTTVLQFAVVHLPLHQKWVQTPRRQEALGLGCNPFQDSMVLDVEQTISGHGLC